MYLDLTKLQQVRDNIAVRSFLLKLELDLAEILDYDIKSEYEKLCEQFPEVKGLCKMD